MSEDEQVRLEAELAKRLLAAGDAERAPLYGEAYDRIYTMSLARAGDSPEEQSFGATPAHVPLLRHVSPPNGRTLEIGCGTGLLTIALADLGYAATGADVSSVAIDRAKEHARGRAEFLATEGVTLPFPDASFDFAFSVETLEHLHERDAPAHAREVARVLRPGARYLAVTPNRMYAKGVAGRWGIDADADVHLREWSFGEIAQLLTGAGFASPRYPWRIPKVRRFIDLPAGVAAHLEHRVASVRTAELLGVNHCRVFAVRH